MNILFLTIGYMESIEEYGIYSDLLRCLRDNGHRIYTVSPYEKKTGLNTGLKSDNGIQMLHVETGNITKCGIVEKGISTLRIEKQFLLAIKKYFSGIKFDLILYSTPPVTFEKVIKYIKKRDNARTYLMLKDIFPQNAVDIGLMTTKGLKGMVYRFFRRKEKRLYAISDKIGCMSEANKDYVLKHNQEIESQKVEICPNCIEVQDRRISGEECLRIRQKYGIPTDKKVFVYGGNLGKPQGISFLIECLRMQKNNKAAYFLIVGDGTEYAQLESFFNEMSPQNMRLMKTLPKEDYDKMIAACDIGMIFLDYRFTIPNFPSRLLSYMQAGLPVLACTDKNTDVGKVIVEGEFGWWCESNNAENFSKIVNQIIDADVHIMGKNANEYLIEHYQVKNIANKIAK